MGKMFAVVMSQIIAMLIGQILATNQDPPQWLTDELYYESALQNNNIFDGEISVQVNNKYHVIIQDCDEVTVTDCTHVLVSNCEKVKVVGCEKVYITSSSDDISLTIERSRDVQVNCKRVMLSGGQNFISDAKIRTGAFGSHCSVQSTGTTNVIVR